MQEQAEVATYIRSRVLQHAGSTQVTKWANKWKDATQINWLSLKLTCRSILKFKLVLTQTLCLRMRRPDRMPQARRTQRRPFIL